MTWMSKVGKKVIRKTNLEDLKIWIRGDKTGCNSKFSRIYVRKAHEESSERSTFSSKKERVHLKYPETDLKIKSRCEYVSGLFDKESKVHSAQVQSNKLNTQNWEYKIHIERLEKEILKLLADNNELKSKLKELGVHVEDKPKSYPEFGLTDSAIASSLHQMSQQHSLQPTE
jgi:hypothetical protein